MRFHRTEQLATIIPGRRYPLLEFYATAEQPRLFGSGYSQKGAQIATSKLRIAGRSKRSVQTSTVHRRKDFKPLNAHSKRLYYMYPRQFQAAPLITLA